MIFLDFISHLESIRHAWILGNKKVDRIQKKSSNHGQISDQVGQKSDQVGQKSGYIPRSTNCPYCHASNSISLIFEATSVYVKYPLIIYLNESI